MLSRVIAENVGDVFLRHTVLYYLPLSPRPLLNPFQQYFIFTTRNTFCGTWYLPHSHVHNERTVPIIMAHEREGYISTSGPKSDVTIVFLDPDFLYDAGISAIRP